MSDEQKLTPAGFDPKPSDGAEPIKAASFEPLSSTAPTAPKQLTVAKAGLAAAVLLIAAVLFFILSARSLQIVVATDTEASVDIEGLAVPVGGRWLLRPGDYRVSIEAPGYEPWASTITVTDRDSQQIEITPIILPGIVDIVSEPSGASVLIDGEYVGDTPVEGLSVPAGEVEIALSLARYQPVQRDVSITGREVSQTLTFPLKADWAEITLTTDPEEATLQIDDISIEHTPDEVIEVLSGQHVLTVSAPGYQSERIELTVEAGIAQTLTPIQLRPADGVLALSSDPTGANVTVDGEFRGRTPLEVSLTPGRSHQITLTRPGFFPVTTSATLAKGSVDRRALTLRPRLGEVVFNIEPADAELWIDGKSMGRGSQRLELTAIDHRVEVKLPGYTQFRDTIRPREGLAQALDVTLITEAEARRAAMQPEVTTALGQTLVLIDPVAEPVNSFTLGAPRRDPGRRANETLRSVRLERAYYIATTETTNAQFRQFLATHDSGQIQGNSLNREHQPVVTISWQQAARFCNWLSDKEGLPRFYREEQGIVTGFDPESTGYRLPTEAEWAYAARIDGEQTRRFAWGDTFPPEQKVTNVADNTSAFVTGRILNGYADGHIVAAPVASYPANHRGLHDMGGNVAEWVHDVYTIPAPSAEEVTDPMGPAKGDNYTVRGASWALSRLSELRLTFRDYGAAGRDDLGFRIARYAE